MGLHYDEQRSDGREETSRPVIILRNVCEICGQSFDNQYMFFKHLKEHYEPEFSAIGYPGPVPEAIDESEADGGDNNGFVNDNEQFEEIFANNINKSPDMIEHLEIFIKNQESRAESYQTNDDRFGVIDGMIMMEDPGSVAEMEGHVSSVESGNLASLGNSIQTPQTLQLPSGRGGNGLPSEELTPQYQYHPHERTTSREDPETEKQRNSPVLVATFPTDSPASPVEEQNEPPPPPESPPPMTDIPDTPQSPPEAAKSSTDLDIFIQKLNKNEGGGGSELAKRTFECLKCNRTFHSRTALSYHMTGHESRKIHCEHCDKMFLTKSTLEVHMRIHQEKRPYPCPECEAKFRQKNDLKYHIQSKHTAIDDFKFSCEFCSKKFARKYSLSLHTKLHTGKKDHHCPKCSKSFRASSYLQVHMRSHSGHKPYDCDSCQKAFVTNADLRRHVGKMHGKEGDRGKPSGAPKKAKVN